MSAPNTSVAVLISSQIQLKICTPTAGGISHDLVWSQYVQAGGRGSPGPRCAICASMLPQHSWLQLVIYDVVTCGWEICGNRAAPTSPPGCPAPQVQAYHAPGCRWQGGWRRWTAWRSGRQPPRHRTARPPGPAGMQQGGARQAHFIHCSQQDPLRPLSPAARQAGRQAGGRPVPPQRQHQNPPRAS